MSGVSVVKGADSAECERRQQALTTTKLQPSVFMAQLQRAVPPQVQLGDDTAAGAGANLPAGLVNLNPRKTCSTNSSSSTTTSRTVRLVLLLMVRNESKIITRCLEAAAPFVDGVCLVDTGSTDDTVELARSWAAARTPPMQLHVQTDVWKNFGHNRSRSFQAALSAVAAFGWPLDTTYALLQDADMQLRAPRGVQTVRELAATFTGPGYKLMQKNGGLEYENARLLRMSVPWRCVGVTHEYWDGAPTGSIPQEVLFIEDVGDGGCKADKFERDCALLEQGLAEEPTNVRYMFYLANTYRDLGSRNDDAIAMYKRRIAAGGWEEEVWYSMVAIAHIYVRKNDLVRMEAWAQRAHAFRPQRAECLYLLTRTFRERGSHFKAWQYMLEGARIPRPADILFVDSNVYKHNFEYERSVLAYYVTPHLHRDTLYRCMELLSANGGNYMNVYTNMVHYVQPLPRAHGFPDVALDGLLVDTPLYADATFKASSTSIARTSASNVLLLNVRYVNYGITPTGAYVMRRDGVVADNEAVRTRNVACWVTEAADGTWVRCLSACNAIEMVPTCAPAVANSRICGLEDLRLGVEPSGALTWIAASCEYNATGDGCIRQVTGTYVPDSGSLTGACTLVTAAQCEKNWVPLGNGRFIYQWHPFEIVATAAAAAATDTGTPATTCGITKVTTAATPAFFKHVRGSTNVVKYGGAAYCLVHVVQYSTPRKYYHMLVKLDAETLVPVAYTVPFYFCDNAIEYTIGLDVQPRTGLARAIVSRNDCNPTVVSFQLDALPFHAIKVPSQ